MPHREILRQITDGIVATKTTNLFNIVIPPLTGIGIYNAVVGAIGETNNYIVAGALVVTLLTYLIIYGSRLVLGLKQIDVTQTQNKGELDMKAFSSSAEISINALKELRTASEVQEKFWADRIDKIREEHKQDLIDLRKEKHDAGNRCNAVSLELGMIKQLLKDKGIKISKDSDGFILIFPTDFEGGS